MSKQRGAFPAEFKREAASLELDQGYSHADSCRSLEVGETAMRRGVDQLRAERKGGDVSILPVYCCAAELTNCLRKTEARLETALLSGCCETMALKSGDSK